MEPEELRGRRHFRSGARAGTLLLQESEREQRRGSQEWVTTDAWKTHVYSRQTQAPKEKEGQAQESENQTQQKEIQALTTA